MPAITVLVDEVAVATAGADELNLLSASLCGGPFGKQSLSVSGIGHMDETENEHLTWVAQQIEPNQIIDLHFNEGGHFSDPDRSISRGGIAEIMTQLESMKDGFDDRKPISAPSVQYPGIYYWIQINSDQPIEAFLDGFDQLQAEIMWSSHKPDIDFGVMSISVKSDGNTAQKYWLNTTLNPGDQVRIVVKQAPDRQANVAAIHVA